MNPFQQQNNPFTDIKNDISNGVYNIFHPNDYGAQVLHEYKGIKNDPAFQNGYSIVNDNPQNTYNRYSESYPSNEVGGYDDQAPNPLGNISHPVVAIYDKQAQKNRSIKRELGLGEAIDVMQAPQFQSLRSEFNNSFTPQAKQRNDEMIKQGAYPNEDYNHALNRFVTNEYLRGGLMSHDPTSSQWTSLYSPQQKDVMNRINTYLKTGKQ